MLSPEDAARRVQAEPEMEQEALPPTKVIDIDCKDGRGNHYKHSFYYQVPTLGGRCDIGKMKALYIPEGGLPDLTAARLVHVACYLEKTIQFNEKFKRPHWWKIWECYDAEPFMVLYQEATSYEVKFLGEDSYIRGDQEESREEDDAAGEHDSTGVGRKIQPPAKRQETLTANGPRGA